MQSDSLCFVDFARSTHGYLVQRALYFTKPTRVGACVRYVRRFCHPRVLVVVIATGGV